MVQKQSYLSGKLEQLEVFVKENNQTADVFGKKLNSGITFEFHGTSHGDGYYGTIKGLPNFSFDVSKVNEQLALRKCGYGRSTRQNYIDSVVFNGDQTATTIAVSNQNVTFFVPNHLDNTHVLPEITALRSGHADLVGQARYGKTARQIAEVASARNSICYVVLGAICRQFLALNGINVYHYTQNIGGIVNHSKYIFGKTERQNHFSVLHCPSAFATQKMTAKIDQAKSLNDSLGGVSVVGAVGVPMGIGEVFPYEARLDSRISSVIMGIPSVKGISFGTTNDFVSKNGSQCADVLAVQNNKIVYQTNNCGGIVGGISNGQAIEFSVVVKPVPTVKNVATIDCQTKQTTFQHYERADTCVVPNVGVIAENILAFVLTDQLLKQNYVFSCNDSPLQKLK